MSTFSAHFIKYASDMSHLLGTDGKLSHNALPFSQQISLETASTTNTEIYPGYHLSPFLKKKSTKIVAEVHVYMVLLHWSVF